MRVLHQVATKQASKTLVLSCGRLVMRNGGVREFDSEGAVMVLNNLKVMVDIERSECAVAAAESEMRRACVIRVTK